MALSISGDNPIVVSGSCSSREKITDDSVAVAHIYWGQIGSANDKLELEKADGEGIIAMEADSTVKDLSTPINVSCDGIYASDFDSGRLFIFHNARF